MTNSAVTRDAVLSLIVQNEQERPGERAVLFEHLGSWEAMTWAGLAERVRVVARGLSGCGVGPRHRLVLACTNPIDLLSFGLAAQACGARTQWPTDHDVPPISGDREMTVLVAQTTAHPWLAQEASPSGTSIELAIAIEPGGPPLRGTTRFVGYAELLSPDAAEHPAPAMRPATTPRRVRRGASDLVLVAVGAWDANVFDEVVAPALIAGVTLALPHGTSTPLDAARQVCPTHLHLLADVVDGLAQDLVAALGRTRGLKRWCTAGWLRRAMEPDTSQTMPTLASLVVVLPLRRQLGLRRARGISATGVAIRPDTVRLLSSLGIEVAHASQATSSGPGARPGPQERLNLL